MVRHVCAFTQDVKEALGQRGNVDHVVMTPAGIWVVDTKTAWLSQPQFRPALRQVAENTRRVRHHIETSLPPRGALVTAGRSNDSLDADYDWKGEQIKAFGAKKFCSVLRVEREQVPSIGRSPEMDKVEGWCGIWAPHDTWTREGHTQRDRAA